MLRCCLQDGQILIEPLSEGVYLLALFINMKNGDTALLKLLIACSRLGTHRRNNRDIAERNRKRALRVVGLNFLARRIQNREIAEELRGCGLARRLGMRVDLCEHFRLFRFGKFSRLQACPLREHTRRCADLNLDTV